MTFDRVRKMHHCFRHRKTNVSSIMFAVTVTLLVALLFVGSTVCFFTASKTTPAQTICAAYYDIASTVKEGDAALSMQNGGYFLQAGKQYAVSLDALGTATTGYAQLVFDGTAVTAVAQTSDATVSFTVDVTQDTFLQILPQWGTPDASLERIAQGATYTY